MKQLIIAICLFIVSTKSGIFCQQITPSKITSAGQVFYAQNIETSFTLGEIVINDFNNSGAFISNGLLSTEETILLLPLTLQKFELSVFGNTATLLWITLQENNTSSFYIEKSINGQQFEEIGKVDAKGNTNTQQQYMYIDTNFKAAAYYRLKMVDRDNQFTYSNILYGKYDNSQLKVIAYPNPFKDRVVISVPSATNNKVNVVISDMGGRQIFIKSYTLTPGNNIITIDGLKFLKGVYILNIEMSGTLKAIKIMKF